MFFIPFLCAIVIIVLIFVYFSSNNSDTDKKSKKGILIAIGLVAFVMIIFPFIFSPLAFLLYGMTSVQSQKESGCYRVEAIENPLRLNNEYPYYTVSERRNSLFGISKKDYSVYRMMPGRGCEVIDLVDQKSFRVLSPYQAKDKNNAYIQLPSSENSETKSEFVIYGIDSETYEVDGVGIYSKDKNHVYKRADIVEGVDPENFHFPQPSDDSFMVKMSNEKYSSYTVSRVENVKTEVELRLFQLTSCMENGGLITDPKSETTLCSNSNKIYWMAIENIGGEWGGCKTNQTNNDFEICFSLPLRNAVFKCNKGGCEHLLQRD